MEFLFGSIAVKMYIRYKKLLALCYTTTLNHVILKLDIYFAPQVVNRGVNTKQI